MSSGPSAGRLFLAAPLTNDVRVALEAHLKRATGGIGIPGRRVAPANWHMTLRFLGDTSARAQDQVVAHLENSDLGRPFTLRYGGLGAFPRPDRARVLWLGTTSGSDHLRRLAGMAEEAATAAGFEPERRKFSAHLTLSRIRPELDVSGLVDVVEPFDVPLPVSEMVLYRSHLGPSGARYEVVRAFTMLGDAR